MAKKMKPQEKYAVTFGGYSGNEKKTRISFKIVVQDREDYLPLSENLIHKQLVVDLEARKGKSGAGQKYVPGTEPAKIEQVVCTSNKLSDGWDECSGGLVFPDGVIDPGDLKKISNRQGWLTIYSSEDIPEEKPVKTADDKDIEGQQKLAFKNEREVHALDLSSLVNVAGVTTANVNRLVEKFDTVGDVIDAMRADPEGWYKDVKSIGANAAAKVGDAVQELFKQVE